MTSYTVLCTYLVRPDKITEFHELLRRHWPALRRYGYVSEEPATIYFGTDSSGPFFVEIMTWADPSAPERAYWTQEINEIWTDFYDFTEPRGDRPAIEYPTVEVQDYFRDFPKAKAARSCLQSTSTSNSSTARQLDAWDLTKPSS